MMKKNILTLGKLAFIIYSTLAIISTIPAQLFALELPDSENRGSPDRTGGAGGRLKPRRNIPKRPSKPILMPPASPIKQDRPEERLTFPVREEKNQPHPTLGGGKHGGSCVKPEKGKPHLTALIPSPQHIGKTIIDNPSLFWYIPKNTATVGGFIVVNNKNNETIYDTTFKLPKTPGIIKLTIPVNVILQSDQTYSWQFSLVCDPEDRSADEYISGQIQKTKLSPVLNSSLLKADPLEQTKIYAKNVIWYDTLSTLANVKKENELDWESLLTSVGLEKVAKEPLLDCCTPDSK